jgi:hypothetical protein
MKDELARYDQPYEVASSNTPNGHHVANYYAYHLS